MFRPSIAKGCPVQVDQLIAELLSRGDMNDDTTLELNRILEDWRADKLDPDDASYVEALHARLMHAPAESVDDIVVPAAAPVARIDGLSIEEWRERALKAEADLAAMQDSTQNG
jgi:hypothetical protein